MSRYPEIHSVKNMWPRFTSTRKKSQAEIIFAGLIRSPLEKGYLLLCSIDQLKKNDTLAEDSEQKNMVLDDLCAGKDAEIQFVF